jgi:hypothetical protein
MVSELRCLRADDVPGSLGEHLPCRERLPHRGKSFFQAAMAQIDRSALLAVERDLERREVLAMTMLGAHPTGERVVVGQHEHLEASVEQVGQQVAADAAPGLEPDPDEILADLVTALTAIEKLPRAD